MASAPPTGPSLAKHVEYILLSEFDVDVGSKIKHQYPQPCGVDESLLAEFMLPDGAHKRDDDWTVFFLHRKDTTTTIAPRKSSSIAIPPTPPAPAPSASSNTSTPSPSTSSSDLNTVNNSLANASLKTTESAPIKLEAFIYKFSENEEDQGWVMLHPDKMALTITQQEVTIQSGDQSYDSKILQHPELEYTQLEPLFSVVLVSSGVALGFRFNNEEEEATFLTHIDQWVAELDSAKSQQQGEGEAPSAEAGDTAPGSAPASPSHSPSHSPSSSTITIAPPAADHTTTATIATTTTTTNAEAASKPFLYCLNFLNNQKTDTARRGALVRTIAICCRHQYIHIYKPFMILALQKYYTQPSIDVLAELYNALNDMPVTTMPQLNDNEKMILRSSNDVQRQAYPTTITYFGKKMNVYLPLSTFPDEVGDYKVITLVNKFGPGVMTIFNGLLQHKRILFLGYGSNAGEVCNFVLATLSMVCPPLRGLVHRAFPYTNLCYLDFLNVPGYITGVTNPMFEEHQEWWDILCNIQTGKVIVNPDLVKDEPDKWAQYDNDFMAEVQSTIATHYGEDKVRSLFQDYMQHLADMTMDEEEWADDQTRMTELEANRGRLDQWRRTPSYATYVKDRIARTKVSFIRDPLVPRYVRRLRKRRGLPEAEVLRIYQAFLDGISTEEQLTEFLACLPEANGGLYPVAVSLFHSSEAVRRLAVELFRRLDSIQAGSGFINGLNQFLFLAYERNLRLFEEQPSSS